jgi:hypothetical protein
MLTLSVGLGQARWILVPEAALSKEKGCLQFNAVPPLGMLLGARGSVVLKALSYKPERRGFDTR